MKNFKFILLTCFCLFLSTVSCDKEPVLSQNQTTPNVIQARANAAANARKDIDKAFLNYDFSKYKIMPMWDLAVVYKGGKSVEVPYTVDGRLIMPSVSKTLKGRQRLLLTLEKSKVSAMIIQYIPEVGFRENIVDINAGNFKSKKFSGQVVFRPFGEEKFRIWLLKDGKVEKKKEGRVISKGKNLRPSGYERVCVMIQTYFEIYGWLNNEWVFIDSYYEDVEYCEWVNVPDGGDDNGGDDDDPTDCNMHPELPWCDNGNGGGGIDESECYASLDAMANETSPSNETISEEVTGNFDGGLIERTYIWKARNGPVWHVESKEKGVINTNTNQFISFTHENAEIVGPHALVSLTSHSTSINPPSSEPSHSKDITLYYTLTYGIICFENQLAKPVPYQQYKLFTAN